MTQVRLAGEDDLANIIDLYQFLNPDDPMLAIDEQLIRHWQAILQDPSLIYLVAEENGALVASCNLTVIKNLTRSARPYGLIENVVTHPDYRKKGYGTAVLKQALNIAKEHNCYKVMLLTSRQDEGVWQVYEKVGFRRDDKTGFIIRFI